MFSNHLLGFFGFLAIQLIAFSFRLFLVQEISLKCIFLK